MPPRQKKPLTWKCLKCNDFAINGNDKDIMKEEGFTHQVENHELVVENRSWFDLHIQNYYEIT